MADEAAFGVHDIGLAVGDGGAAQVAPGPVQGGGHAREAVLVVQRIARVEEDDVVARGLTYALVHGVVEARVGLSDHTHAVGHSALHIALDSGKSTVRAAAVHQEMLHAGIGLSGHTAERALQRAGGVVGAGDDAYERRRFHRLLTEMETTMRSSTESAP